MRPTTFFLLIICNACDCYLVSNVAENELVWEMSELISKVAGLICAVICEEDSDHSPGVRLDNRVRRHNCQPADQALPSLINKITGDTNNISQQLGWRQFGNHAIRKPDNHSQNPHGQSGMVNGHRVNKNISEELILWVKYLLKYILIFVYIKTQGMKIFAKLRVLKFCK